MSTNTTLDTIVFANREGHIVSMSRATPSFVSRSNDIIPTILETWTIDYSTSNRSQYVNSSQSTFSNFTSRPYYVAGLSVLNGGSDDIIWTAPFARGSTTTPGIVSFAIGASTPIFDKNTPYSGRKTVSQVYGVATCILDLGSISSFLNVTSFKTVTNTQAFILDRVSGVLVGTTIGRVTMRDANNTLVSLRGTESEQYLVKSLSTSITSGTLSGTITDGGTVYSWRATEYNDPYGIRWYIVTATERQTFLQTVLQGGVWAVVVSILVLIASTIIIGIVMTLVTRKLHQLAVRMNRMSLLIFDRKTTKRRSIFAEVRLMEKAMEATSRGLRSFSKYIPVDVVRTIMAKGSKEATAEVEKRDMTILFTDVVDFTNMIEAGESEKLLKVINEHFSIMVDSVERNGGIVDKFIGDAVMALYNHQKEHEGESLQTHARSACYTAIECQKELAELRKRCREQLLPEVFIRIGINTGKTLVGNVGSSKRLNFTAMGDTVNSAARLESLNKRYGTDILIGDETFCTCGKEFICFFVDTVKLKGKNKSMCVYHLRKLRCEATEKEILAERRLQNAADELLARNFPMCRDIIEKVLAMELEQVGYVEMLFARVKNLCDMSSEAAVDNVHLILHEK
jgi:class 3 adenylate cyclase